MAKPKSSHKKPTQEELDKLAKEAEALKKKTPKLNKEDEEAAKKEASAGNEDEDEDEDEDDSSDDDEGGDDDSEDEDEDDDGDDDDDDGEDENKPAIKPKKPYPIAATVSGAIAPRMKAEFPESDIMEDFSKELSIESVMSKRFRNNLKEAREEGKKIEKWNEEVDKFVDDPETLTKNPDLEGKLDEFKVYAADEANNGIPFKVLISAFLHNANIPTKNKGGMFPKGSAGTPDKKKKDNKLTIEEGRKLRKTDQRKWKTYLRSGRIQMDVEK